MFILGMMAFNAFKHCNSRVCYFNRTRKYEKGDVATCQLLTAYRLSVRTNVSVSPVVKILILSTNSDLNQACTYIYCNMKIHQARTLNINRHLYLTQKKKKRKGRGQWFFWQLNFK